LKATLREVEKENGLGITARKVSISGILKHGVNFIPDGR